MTLIQRPTKLLVATIALLAGYVSLSGAAWAQNRPLAAPDSGGGPLRELISGYDFSPVNVRALQDDDFDNPGFAWVAKGEANWRTVEGSAGESCGTCHGLSSDAMRGKAATFPKFYQPESKVINLEQRINICRRDKMGAPPWAYESEELLGMTAFLRLQSRGLPADIRVDGPAKVAFDAGQALYSRRLGQFGISCAQCHNEHYGKTYGDRTISQGHANGFPTYRVDEKAFRSLHRQFTECFARMRAETMPPGSEDSVALEFYLSWRGAGLPLQAPAVRR
jgi:sulfur-oxidizing protein SoxA